MQIIIVGCGHMGGAMLEGWLASHILAGEDAHIVAPNFPLKNLGDYSKTINFAQHHTSEIASLTKDNRFTSDNTMIVVAVIPQIMKDVLPNYQAFADKNIPFMTVAAGLPEAFYRNILGEKTPIIRVMPNMPTSIGRGMNAICYNQYCYQTVKETTEKLMRPLGEIDILQSESEMDAFTALAGSGPAYLFALVKAMSDAGVALGFEQQRAQRLALQTVLGASEYMNECGLSAEQLMAKIALAGGTTEAALAQLNNDNALGDLMKNALKAAKNRSAQMGKDMS
ncbi:MAG: pyrroline-5-carboxylate reductase [Alphaproteobacteria bacterium]|nr:pyrroline-5-carboxylate reductase [Alphaproteobacteria bacterium]